MLGGDNGLVKSASTSKEKTKIAEEKEKVKLAQYADLINNDGKKNTKEGLKRELDQTEGENKTKVTKVGKDSYIVTFLDTNRNYKIQWGQELEGPVEIEVMVDDDVGDISKGNTLDGSKEKPYQISCIEDLVDFSNKSETIDFTGKEITLTRNLDFLSELSYGDYQTKKYGDINNDGKTSELMEELTTGIGFKGIDTFRGNFDGQNKKLDNLYINSDEAYVGLFKKISNSVVKNLIVNGKIKGRETVGGIISYASGECSLYNLKYSGTISENNKCTKIGGIVGWIGINSNVKINQCTNYSNIAVASGNIGGVVGRTDSKTKVVNCCNMGNLTLKLGNNSQGSVGGMIANVMNNDNITFFNVENCYNTGKIINEVKNTYNSSGGIVGTTTNCKNIIIANSYNVGETKAQPATASGGIHGSYWYYQYQSTIINCYYDGSKSDRSVYQSQEEYATKLTTNQMQGKEKIQNQDGTSDTLVELLNKGLDDKSTNVDTSDWLRWKEGENGYPIFQLNIH